MEQDYNTVCVELGISFQQWRLAMQDRERAVLLSADDGQRYWLKKSAPERGFWRYQALNMFSYLFRLPLLKAVPQQGGRIALNTEIKRLKQLSRATVAVPELVAQAADWLLLRDLGNSAVDYFKDSNVAESDKQALLRACLQAMRSVHDKQLYLSQAFVRNMIVVNQDPWDIGFIDFEDDPLEVMDLAHAQARDLLLFVDSVARFFMHNQDFFKDCIDAFLSDHNVEVKRWLRQTVVRLNWVTRMPLQRHLGHDYQKLKLGLVALYHCLQHDQ